MLLTTTPSSRGRGPQKLIHGLSILKGSRRSPGPVSWVRCTNIKVVLHHWCLILRAWHRHPFYCANSEPRSHPGHSLSHAPFCNQSSNRSCSFLLCPPPLSKATVSRGQDGISHTTTSPLAFPLVSVWQAGWSSKKASYQNHLSPPHTHLNKQRESFHWKETIPVYEWGHTLEWVGSRGKRVRWKKIKHGREEMNETPKISTGLILSYFGDLGWMCNIANVQYSNQYSLPRPLFSNFRN